MISIRAHCIPCYDELSRIQSVASQCNIELCPEFEMEQKTAGDIVKKLHSVVNTEWFRQLPSYATITSGAVEGYLWSKEKAVQEENRIWKDCKSYV